MKEEINSMYVIINNNKLRIDLYKNIATEKLIVELQKGEIVYIAHDYGNFEKVGDLPFSLPTANEYISVGPGDVVLYVGRSLCLYYGENEYTFTRIGRINGYTSEQIRALLGAGNGDCKVVLGLE